MHKLLGLPLNASEHGAEIDNMLGLVHWLMLLLFVGWGAFFIYTLVRFRKSKQPKANYAGVKSHISSYTEGAVVVAEALLLIVFAIPIWADVMIEHPQEQEAVTVRVVAQQFAWNIHYPGADGIFGRTELEMMNEETNPLGLDRSDPDGKDDITTINQLHLPVDRAILIYLSSKDVIHSFALPEMRVKQDAVPGMRIPVSFKAKKTGEWEIACAQLCGLGHYRMRGYFTVHDAAGYNTWLQEQADQLIDTGEDVW
jgi:cytochrome c oxidase subunit 2